MEEKSVQYVQDAIDLMVQGAEDEFPAMGDILARMNIATHGQLAELEAKGHIKSVSIDVPSVIMPTQTVKAKAYYTERRVPKLVEAMLQPQGFSIEGVAKN